MILEIYPNKTALVYHSEEAYWEGKASDVVKVSEHLFNILTMTLKPMKWPIVVKYPRRVFEIIYFGEVDA